METDTRENVELKTIVSDYDGNTYCYPHIFDEGISFSQEEIFKRVQLLRHLQPNQHGLYGLHLSPKLELFLDSQCIEPQEYAGFEWLSNIKDSKEALNNGLKRPRQLKLFSRKRNFDYLRYEWRNDAVFHRFSIHPESGEFVGAEHGFGQHATHISRFGSYHFSEYVRFVYDATDQRPEKAVLLSRAYYCPEKYGEKYHFEKDKEIQLFLLAILIKNGFPEGTQIGLSASRQMFRLWGVE